MKRVTRKTTAKDRGTKVLGTIDMAIRELEKCKRRDTMGFLEGQAAGMLRLAHETHVVSDAKRAALRDRIDAAVKRANAKTEDEQRKQTRQRSLRDDRALVQRDFWVEQARALQNQLQQVQHGFSTVLEFVASNPDYGDDVLAAIQQVQAQLARPITGVEAARALQTEHDPSTQGAYTAKERPELGARHDLPGRARLRGITG